MVAGGRGDPAGEARTGPAIRLEEVTKVYPTRAGGVRALDGVTLQVEPGEFLGIVGPSGSGKSTLLQIMGCLDRPTSGRVLIAGADATTLPRRRLPAFRNRHIGFVFQDEHLVPTLTAVENVSVPLRYAGVRRREALLRARAWLERLGLSDRLDHFPDQLSGGERQRVAVARALGHNPSVVLADEPTGALDQRSGRALLELLSQLNAELGQTVVLVTHDPAAAARCDRVIRLVDGRLEQA